MIRAAALAMLVTLAAASPAAAGSQVFVSVGVPPGLPYAVPGSYPAYPYPYPYPYAYPYPYYPYPPAPVAAYPAPYPYVYYGGWQLGLGFGWGYRHFTGRGESIQGYTLPGRR